MKTLDTDAEQKESQSPPKAAFRLLEPRHAASIMPLLLEAIFQSLPHELCNQTAVNNVSAALLNGELQPWALLRVVNGNVQIVGIASTFIYTERWTGPRTLCLYTVYSIQGVGPTEWKIAYDALEEYARTNGCARMTAFALNEKIGELATSFGWTVGPNLLVKEVA